MLTIYPDSELYAEIQRGNWQEEGELEKYKEVRTLIENLQILTMFAGIRDTKNKEVWQIIFRIKLMPAVSLFCAEIERKNSYKSFIIMHGDKFMFATRRVRTEGGILWSGWKD